MELRLHDGRAVTVRGARLRTLLALLLLNTGRVVSAEKLIDELYGSSPPVGVANALQRQISRLRGALDAPIEYDGTGYRLAADPLEVDAYLFERIASEGSQALAGGDHSSAVALLDRALGLWRGPALAGADAAPSASAHAVGLEELRVTAAEDLAEAELALGEHTKPVGALKELVAAHPLRERACALLMRALYAGGRQADALAVFERTRQALAERLGANPSADLAKVHMAVLAGDASVTVSAPSPPLRAGGLPAQLTSFVGREDDVRGVLRLLNETRLVTLTGPGGSGKTRLAIEVGRLEADACLVELARLRDGADVPWAVLGALGLRETGLLHVPHAVTADLADRLAAALADRRMLLVLDNCEHVVEAAAHLADRLLSACPGLRILATGREALGITGEMLYPVRPLALPPPQVPPAEALTYPAIRLFADRAAAVQPGFEVDDAVLRICRALDGLPLAIELAAARLRSLPAAEVAARLDDRFALLSQGSRTASPRHRTLRAVVEWSWDLLSDDERTAARRLAVFAGAVTLEAVEQVCGTPVDVLTGLADKSLVEAAGGRYRMLETVRAFCAELLTRTEEEDLLRRAHAEYFLRLARQTEPRLRSAGQRHWLDVFAAEDDDTNAAVRWAVANDTGLAMRLVAALTTYWLMRGMLGEGGWAGEILDRTGTTGPPGLEEEYVMCVIGGAMGGAADRDLHPHILQAQRILDRLDRAPHYPLITMFWPSIARLTENPDAAAALIRHSRASQDPWTLAAARASQGFAAMAVGRLDEAEPELTAALETFRSLGERLGMAPTLTFLGMLLSWRGDHARGVALTGEAIELVGQMGATADMADLLCERGEEWVRAGDLAAARADFDRAAEVARRAGSPHALAAARHGLGEVARLSGDLEEARRWLESALSSMPATAWTEDDIRMRVLIALARVCEAEGDSAGARERLEEAVVVGARNGEFDDLAKAAEALAGVALMEGGGERAALLLGAGVALRGAARAGDPDTARVSAAAIGLIGHTLFGEIRQKGETMSPEEALTLLMTLRSAGGP
ncbi:BTAD domain-containing putative transcriptional regulator [Nonomuraea sp. NPDC050643]|uniref:BTAD domain-containing putative transcriptional regulator n=1 Tax=Nonomuraea sp. NPDC050643 TaxID=3155660 RepID=UPI0033EE738B